MTAVTVTPGPNNIKHTCCCGSAHIVTGADFFASSTILLTLIAVLLDVSISSFDIVIYACLIIPSLLVLLGTVYEDPIYLVPAMLAEVCYFITFVHFFFVSFFKMDVRNPYSESPITSHMPHDVAVVFIRTSVILALFIIFWKLDVYSDCIDYLASRKKENKAKPKTPAAKSSQPGVQVYPLIV